MVEFNKYYTLMCKDELEDYFNILDEVAKSRPTPNRSIDQIFMFTEYMLLQAVLLKPRVKGKDLIFIGDGDHISVALAKIAEPKSITVLDIDNRILDNISMWGEKIKYTIHTHQYDVFNPMSKIFQNKFDFFYTNPPYGSKNNGESIIAFMKRGMESIKKRASGCIVMPFQESKEWTIKNSINIEKFILENGFVIDEKINDLHKYDLKEEPDLTSCNLIIKRVNSVKQDWKGKRLESIEGFY